jgi:hypothetical protein
MSGRGSTIGHIPRWIRRVCYLIASTDDILDSRFIVGYPQFCFLDVVLWDSIICHRGRENMAPSLAWLRSPYFLESFADHVPVDQNVAFKAHRKIADLGDA